MPDMRPDKKTCFVVMGFGMKADFETGRNLNLDATYQNLIKPAVEESGLECLRADEIVHSGAIDAPMYRQILTADLVIADVSTANASAFYELGVRHALRPHGTIIISEDKFKFPFDLGRIVVRTYKHLGEDIGVSDAMKFRAELKQAIRAAFEQEPPQTDSPVYTFIRQLRPPALSGATPDEWEPAREPGPTPAEDVPSGAESPTYAALMRQVAEAKQKGDFITAKALLFSVRNLMKGRSPERPEDPYIIQQLALVTYKSKQPTPAAALEEARELLLTLDPATSNDTETLGLWGAVHKRLWDETKRREHLDEAVRAYERGFYLRNDYYNGINLAYMFNVRAVNAASPADAVADFVEARRVRREVLEICEEMLKAESLSDEQRFWVLATVAEALLGAGDRSASDSRLREAEAVAPSKWMVDSAVEQLDKLLVMLTDSPLRYVAAA
jgi:hypothetical protein